MLRSLTAAAIAVLAAASAWSADAPTSSFSSGEKVVSPALVKPTPPAADVIPAKPFVYTPKESDIVTGKADAPVTIVEYASLSCPHCSHFFINELPKITEKYIETGKVKLVFRNYLRNGADLDGARLIECSEPEHREAYVKVLMKTQMKWAYDANYREALANIAVYGGMDRLRFEACMNNKDVDKTVLNVGKEAEDDYKVNSTPTFFVNGSQYKSRFDATSMGLAIDAALGK